MLWKSNLWDQGQNICVCTIDSNMGTADEDSGGIQIYIYVPILHNKLKKGDMLGNSAMVFIKALEKKSENLFVSGMFHLWK